MLRTIPENESDHAMNAADSLGSVSAAASDGYDDDEDNNNNNSDKNYHDKYRKSRKSSPDDEDKQSIVSSSDVAVLADPEGGAQRSRGLGDQDGLLNQQQQQEQSLRKKRRQKRRRRRKRRWASWRSVVVMTIVVAAAIGIVVAIVTLTNNDNDSEGAAQDELNQTDFGQAFEATPSPTVSPTIDPETVASLDAMIDDFLVNLNDATDLTSDTKATLIKAREHARRWMLTRDLLRDEVLADPSTVRLKQRYILALFFYSVHVNVTTEQEDATMLMEESECQWSFVHCDMNIVEQTDTTTIRMNVVRRIQYNNMGAVGVLPPELRSLRYLQELSIAGNSIKGSIPSYWFEVPPNASVNSSTTIADTEVVNYLPYLYLLDCAGNQLEGELPQKIWTLPSLRFIYLTNNTFSGSFPTDADLENIAEKPSSYLEDIFLDKNDFSGPLPTWVFRLDILKSLIVEHNHFNGSLSLFGVNGLEALQPSLVTLDVSYNNLEGEIPQSLFLAEGLRYLYLDHNQFTGVAYTSGPPEHSIPLKDVWLHANELQGPIPFKFGEFWPNLQQFKLHRNQLTGTIETQGCQDDPKTGEAAYWPDLVVLKADCNSTNVTCDCCTTCY